MPASIWKSIASRWPGCPSCWGGPILPRVLPLEGGFAGLFQLDFSNRLFGRKYKDPVLVSCTDGVGTKLKVACASPATRTVGIDLVAMSVNDALCCGAEPLFFLDYVAMPKDDPDLLEQLVEGFAAGCLEADCALLGGETAILPDLYAPGDYDLAGFCVGVCPRSRSSTARPSPPDDLVLGLASTGLHSNGYSLARKIVFDIAGLKVNDHVEELGPTVGEALLGADADLRPRRAAGAELLSRQERGPRHRPHHRRRAAREPRPHRARGRPGGRSTAAAGRCRRSSPGSSGWARSSRPRWTRCSTWAWGWCWS